MERAWANTMPHTTFSEYESLVVFMCSPCHTRRAMCLLAQYYLFKGRILEGCYHSSSATRFAVTMGFHQLNSRMIHHVPSVMQHRSVMGMKRWQPSDEIELGEAINVWWYVFSGLGYSLKRYLTSWIKIFRICCALDFGGSILNGLPESVAPSDVTTVWPRPIDDFENVSHPTSRYAQANKKQSSILPDDDHSVAALLNPDLPVSDVSRDNFKCMVAKAAVVLQSASKLDTERVASELLDGCPSGYR